MKQQELSDSLLKDEKEGTLVDFEFDKTVFRYEKTKSGAKNVKLEKSKSG